MDADRFDAIVRSLPVVPRRTAFASLLGAGLAALLGRFSSDDAAAKKKRRKKKRKKKCKGGKKKCGKKCIPKTQCCGGCDEVQQCCEGACILATECCGCSEDQQCCDGACIPKTDCCGGCDAVQQCCNGTCIPETECCGGCGENQVCCEGTCAGCCTSDDCPVDVPCVDGICECPIAGEVACGAFCCPASQACVGGACGCPEAACAAAIDPTDDQFENCFCALATDGEAYCFANIACAEPPPTCQETSECAAGAVCIASSCQAVSRCSPVCSLR